MIEIDQYYEDMKVLCSKITGHFDCIVAAKRSGWILGVFLSHQLRLPVFTVSEIKSIPEKFKNVLVVDDKIYEGVTVRGIASKLRRVNKISKTACMYIEKNVFSDYYIREYGKKIKLWYDSYDEAKIALPVRFL